MVKRSWWAITIVVMVVVGLIPVSQPAPSILRNSVAQAQSCPARDFNLPWKDGDTWYYTGGPHPTDEDEGTWDGLDFAPSEGTSGAVRAVADGIVRHHPDYWTYGQIYIDHDGDDWFSHYVHLNLGISDPSKKPAVNGKHVKAGEIIGYASNTSPDTIGVHLHLGFACGSYGNYLDDIEDNPITLEGWKPYNYQNGDDITRPWGHLPEWPYHGYLKLGNEIRHACSGPCPSPYNSNEVRKLRAGCGVVYPGYNSSQYPKWKAAFDAGGGETGVGCSQNATHFAGEVVNGTDYRLVLQDFVNNGDLNVIILDEVDGAQTAYRVVGDIHDAYFAVDNWWMKLGAPTNNESAAAQSPQGTNGVWQRFEDGNVYSSPKGAFAVYGIYHDFHDSYGNGGTRSPLGFPRSRVYSYNNSTFQYFEGGVINCNGQGSCSAVLGDFCSVAMSGAPNGGVLAAIFDTLTGVSVAHAQTNCDPNSNPDTIPPHLGTTQLPEKAVNAFKPRVQVFDNASNISWVQFHYKVPGGNFTAVNMSQVGTTDVWETNLNTLGYSNGQVIEYLFWAQDTAGNAAQISGLYSVPVQNDQAIPTIAAIDLPPGVDNTLAVNVRVEDANPVSWVTLHVRPQGGGFVQVPMTYNGDSWVATYNTSSYNTGQVLEYLFWAQDEPGNVGQISGLYQTTVQDFSLGRGVVSLTFDDGLESTYTEARPVLDQYDLPGVAYVTTGWTGTTGYMTWSQIQALQNTYGWEIGAHSVTHAELPAISESAMIDEVEDSRQALLNNSLNVTTFATPFGSYNSPTVREIAKLYQAHRGFWDRDSLNVYPYDRYWVQVKSVERDVSVQQIYNWIDRARQRGEWLVLVFHDIADNPDPDEAYVTSTADLTAIAQYLSQKQVPVKTVRQVLDEVEEKQVNLFPNNQFQSGIAGGWTTDRPALVTSDSGTHGAHPQAQHSIKFVGGAQASHLFSSQLPIDSALTYVFKAFVNTEALTSGEFGFYVDEYDASGNWISGQWQGAASLNRVREHNFTYKPSSSSVKKLSWQLYLTAGSSGTVYVDGVHLSVKDNALLNSSFEELENGWALHWTGDTNYLVVNTQGQGSNGNNAVVFPANPPSNKFLFSELLPVNPSLTYYWRTYVKSSTAGNEFGFYIDEYDSAGNWISGQWKGNITTAFDGWKQYVYTPTSGNVAKVRLQYYLLAASAQQVTLDQVSFSNQGDLQAPTGSVVNPPTTVDEELTLRVQASDNYAGVAWVEVVFYLDGEYYDDLFLTYNATSGKWEVDYPTDYIHDGAVLEYDIWIADKFGNELNLNHTTTVQH
jgi:peptidoglycan/xylan/chitin deacetylase (PgdA/CDA1 family)